MKAGKVRTRWWENTMRFVGFFVACLLLFAVFVLVYCLFWGGCEAVIPSKGRRVEGVSANGRYVARMKQADLADERTIEVLEVNDANERHVWNTVTEKLESWAWGSIEVFVANDGKNVVVYDHLIVPPHDGLEFFNEAKGEVTKHMTSIPVDFTITPSSFGVDDLYCFVYEEGEESYFCMSDGWGQLSAAVWNCVGGERVELSEVVVANILERAYARCVQQVKNRYNMHYACKFLGRLKRAEDRPLLEELLSDGDFATSVLGAYKKSRFRDFFKKLGLNVGQELSLCYFIAEASSRRLSDQILGQWDHKATKSAGAMAMNCEYHFLGNARVAVLFPKRPKRRGGLWVYLVPDSTDDQDWDKERPIHFIKVEFGRQGRRVELAGNMPCVFRGVTPGRYWIKAVWDKAKPFAAGDANLYRPQKGDYESSSRVVIEVKAGETTDAGTIECDRKIKGK